ncbi:juvenile hormone acid O-methyltransferase-like [Brevipalpus obovatus]|uniref:juvenile hormone acid O-methyltransferase-like n=1 Tax=Brevipalpus obovatus TaxID=246614 RepID=UPI003D9E6FFB
MMNVLPELYDQSNNLQKQDSQFILQSLKNDYDKRHIGLLIDVGCGSGNITQDIVHCVDVDKAMGLDLNQPMVEYAQKIYGNKVLSFHLGDICDQWDKVSSIPGIVENGVDIVTSSYCLHWVSDQSKAMSNVARMLKPGGKCYLTMFSWSQLLPIQEQITFHPRWANIFRQHLATDPEEKPTIKQTNSELEMPIRARRKSSAPFPVFEIPSIEERTKKWSDLCTQCGLDTIEVKVNDSTFTYDDIEGFKGELQSLCHYLSYIPEDQRDQFMNDYFEHMDNCYIKRQETLPKVKVDYQFMSVIARKPSNQSETSNN